MRDVLPTLSRLFSEAFRLVRWHARVAFPLAILPAVPLVLAFPLSAEVFAFETGGLDFASAAAAGLSAWTVVLAILGALLASVLDIAAFGGMIVAFSSPEPLGARAALRVGFQRWVPIFWSQFLVGLVLLLVALPTLLAGVLLARTPSAATFGLALILVLAALSVIAALIVGTWYVFAGLLAARGEARGVPALVASRRLVEGHTLHTLGLLLAFAVFALALAVLLRVLLPGLTLLQSAVSYLIVALLRPAYLVVLADALRRA